MYLYLLTFFNKHKLLKSNKKKMKNLFFVGLFTLLITSCGGEQKNETFNSATNNVEVQDSTPNSSETVKPDTTVAVN